MELNAVPYQQNTVHGKFRKQALSGTDVWSLRAIYYTNPIRNNNTAASLP